MATRGLSYKVIGKNLFKGGEVRGERGGVREMFLGGENGRWKKELGGDEDYSVKIIIFATY